MGEGEPQLQVLVQWEVLLPNETTWENWASLKATHHLEDKVLLDGLGNDRPKTENGEDTRGRPKKGTTAPICLKDYVWRISSLAVVVMSAYRVLLDIILLEK